MRSLIVEADGASRGNPGAASYGSVVRDADTGELLAELAEAIGHATNNVAEYRGVIAGLEAARQIDPAARVEVRMDSKLVVEQLSGRWQVKHPAMKPLYERARRAFPANGVTFAWVPRSQNKHADKLANQALDAAVRGEVWRSSTPLGGARSESAATGGSSGTAVSSGTATTSGGSDAEGEPQAGMTPDAGSGFGSGAVPGTASAAEQGSLFGSAGQQEGGGEHAVRRGASTASTTPTAPAAGWSADMGAPTRLLLLRHGVTPLTGEKRFSGLGGDPELIADGLAQAQAAALRLSGRAGWSAARTRSGISAGPGLGAASGAGVSSGLGVTSRLGASEVGAASEVGESSGLGVTSRLGAAPGIGAASASGAGAGGDPRYGRIDAIIVSPLRRAQQTALAVADAVGLEPRSEAGFRELDFGALEGLTFAEARERYPQELADFLSSAKIPAPGGESIEEVAARVAAARDRTIVRFPRKTVLVVTHVTPIKTLICQALGAPLEAVNRMELAPASLSVIDYYSDGVVNVRCVNDTAHLY